MKITSTLLAVLGLCSVVYWLVPLAAAHTSSPPGFKTWSPGETVTYSDLNQNFQHIHNTFTGNIRDENVAISAGIQHRKLAQPALIPKAIATAGNWSAACDAAGSAVCQLGSATTNVVSIIGSGTAGVYKVTLNYTPTATPFPVLVTPMGSTSCWAKDYSTIPPHFYVYCGASVGFSIAVF